jgi:hypothetical protein
MTEPLGPEWGRGCYPKVCAECGASFEAKYPSVKTCSESCRRVAVGKSKTKNRKAGCHPNRRHYAKGLCEACYSREKRRRLHGSEPRPPKPAKPRLKPAKPRRPAKLTCGHDSIPHKGRGLCASCYDKQHRSRTPATCHPDRPHHAKGLCEACYRGRQNRQRDARLRGGPNHTQAEWEALLRVYRGCPRCRRPWNEVGTPTRDHVVSIEDGGDDSISNIQPLCYSCNNQKQHRSERYPVY